MEEQEVVAMVALQGHRLVSARFAEDGAWRHLVGCLACGIYAVGMLEGMRQNCPGCPDTKGRKEQLRALRRCRHPLRKNGSAPTLEEVRPVSVAQLAWLGELWSAKAAEDLTRPRPGGELAQEATKWLWLAALRQGQLDAFGGEAGLSERLLSEECP